MTIQNRDQYVIYENIVVVKAVDLILEYVSAHIHALYDLLYTDGTIQFNLLDRLNHLSYFLAMGKLHVGYVRDYAESREEASRCLEKLVYIDRTLKARTGCKLYKECTRKKMQLPLIPRLALHIEVRTATKRFARCFQSLPSDISTLFLMPNRRLISFRPISMQPIWAGL